VIEMIDGLPAHKSTSRRLIGHFNLDGARQKFVLHHAVLNLQRALKGELKIVRAKMVSSMKMSEFKTRARARERDREREREREREDLKNEPSDLSDCRVNTVLGVIFYFICLSF